MPVYAAPPTIKLGDPDSSAVSWLVDLKRELFIGFADHDQKLGVLLAGAKQQVVNYTSVQLDAVAVTLTYGLGLIEERLPVGPVLVDELPPIGRAQCFMPVLPGGSTGLTLSAEDWPLLVGALPTVPLILTYVAGYLPGKQPPALKLAVIYLAANGFDAADRNWKALAHPFRRATWAS